MIADELRRQSDVFLEIYNLRDAIGRPGKSGGGPNRLMHSGHSRVGSVLGTQIRPSQNVAVFGFIELPGLRHTKTIHFYPEAARESPSRLFGCSSAAIDRRRLK